MQNPSHQQQHVIVLGAGVIGAACAFRLAARGHRVTLIDAGEPGAGCSYGNAGVLAIDHIVPLASPAILRAIPRMLVESGGPLRVHPFGVPSLAPWLAHFAKASRVSRFVAGRRALAALLERALPAWRALAREAGISALFRERGTLYVYETAAGLVRAAADGAALREFGIAFDDLDADAVQSRYLSHLRKPCLGGRFIHAMASVSDPYAVVTGLVAAARARGVGFVRDEVRALRIEPAGGHTDAARVAALVTAKREWRCDQLVLSAGVASARFAKALGIAMPLTRERGYHCDVGGNADALLPLPVAFAERGFFCNPMDGRVRLAGTAEFGAGDSPDLSRAAILRAHIHELFGCAPDALPVLSRWYGDRPTLPDYLPMLGRPAGIGNVFVSTGHQHLGLTLAALSAELTADVIEGREASISLDAFHPGRFCRLTQ